MRFILECFPISSNQYTAQLRRDGTGVHSSKIKWTNGEENFTTFLNEGDLINEFSHVNIYYL